MRIHHPLFEITMGSPNTRPHTSVSRIHTVMMHNAGPGFRCLVGKLSLRDEGASDQRPLRSSCSLMHLPADLDN